MAIYQIPGRLFANVYQLKLPQTAINDPSADATTLKTALNSMIDILDAFRITNA